MNDPNNMPRVSIVVPNYNSMKYIENFIKSLLALDYPDYEIIIVDDKSTDGTTEFLEKASKEDPKIKLIKTLQKRGLPRSRNIAIECATGEYIAFAETDMEFDKGWLKEAIRVLEADPTVGAISGKVLDLTTKDIIQTIGLKLIPQTGWVICIGFGEKDGEFPEKSEEVTMGSVGTIARRSVINTIRGYDEEMDRVDDIDLGWRIWISGNRIVSVPESICYHVTFKSWEVRKRSVTKIQQEMAMGRMLRMMIKNYETSNLIQYLPQAIAALIIRALLNALRGNINSVIGLFYIFGWGIRSLPSTLKERKYIQSTRKMSDDQLFKGIMIEANLKTVYRKYHIETIKKLYNFGLSK
jgi:GT2 family glycosyltransferase